jgi:2-methylisocitrate lyase-like PEP mutase family enzyme
MNDGGVYGSCSPETKVEPAAHLRQLISGGFHIVPGAYDCLSAKVAESAGFDAVYVSGYGLAASRLGRPDLGLMTMTEMAEMVDAIAGSVSVPVIADADTGYGGTLNVARLVQTYEAAGAAGIQFEDQQWPKRCGHMGGKKVVPCEEMTAKILAAVDARTKNTVIIARTDALAIEGFENAIARARCYLEAGADMLFVEAPAENEQVRQIPKQLPAAHMINMAETGKAINLSADELAAAGYRIAIYPVTGLLTVVRALSSAFAVLRKDRTSNSLADRMLTFREFNTFIGADSSLACDARYQEAAAAALVQRFAIRGEGANE